MKLFRTGAIVIAWSISACVVLRPLHAQEQWDQSIFLRNLHPEKGEAASAVPQYLPLPSYPIELLRAAVTGFVEVRFRVGEGGAVTDVTIVSAAPREFGEPARAGVGQWKFSPARDRKTGASASVWMRCNLIYKLDFEDGLPTFFPAFAHTRLSGHEVLQLALDAAKKQGVNLDGDTGFAYPQIVVVQSKDQRLMWGVTWSKKDVFGEFVRLWIDDKTRQATFEHRTDGDFTFPERRQPH